MQINELYINSIIINDDAGRKMARKKRGLRVYDADFWLIISLFCIEIPIYEQRFRRLNTQQPDVAGALYQAAEQELKQKYDFLARMAGKAETSPPVSPAGFPGAGTPSTSLASSHCRFTFPIARFHFLNRPPLWLIKLARPIKWLLAGNGNR